MSKVLWLDADGVLLDWSRPFLKFIKSDVSYDELTQYDLSNLFNGYVPAMVNAINHFNETSTYENLQPLVSPEELRKLKTLGFELRIISQVDGEYSRVLRVSNLENVFGKDMFSTIILTGRGQKKAEVLRQFEPYEVIKVVEDNPQFFRDAREVGGFDSMAIQHPYNQKELKEIPGFPIYMNMQEVIRHLTVIGD